MSTQPKGAGEDSVGALSRRPADSFFRPSSLTAKITLPFMALFGVLLLALGAIVAREILQEVERRVEDEQRFVLEVAAFPGWPISEDSLRRIRDASAGNAQIPAEFFSEFIVLQDNARPLTTLAPGAEQPARLRSFELVLERDRALDPKDELPHRARIRWEERDWLALSTARLHSRSAAGEAPRRFFLLHPYAEILATQHKVLWRLSALGLLGLLLAAALGLLLGRWIARPVRRLAALARTVTAQGAVGLSGPLESVAPDAAAGGEIGDLSRAFSSMLESIRHSQDELVKAERLAAVGKLAANVAHEIRNPLTSLRMTIEMLRDKRWQNASSPAADNDANSAQAYKIVLNEIDRLSLSIGRLLMFCNPKPPSKKPVDINRLVRETAEFLDVQMRHSHIEVQLKLDATVPAISLDAEMIRQVLVNLILNAQQAIVRNGMITLCTRHDGRQQKLIVEVLDTGHGVPKELGGKIWDVFVSSKPEGGGLGLAICKQIVEEHSGTISFDSVPGKTCFRMILPES